MAFSPETYALLKAQGGGGSFPSDPTAGYDIVITASDNEWLSTTTFTLTRGTSSAVWDKLNNGEYVRALIICDVSWYTFPAIYTYDSIGAYQTSTEGTVGFFFFDNYSSAPRYIYIESDGTVYLD